MSDPTQARLNVNPARNGHDSAVQPSHVFVTWPPPSVLPLSPVSATAADVPQQTPIFPHITSEEEGLAAPGILTTIPDHPILGGPLYASGPLSRDSRYLLVVTNPAFKRLYEDYPLRATRLRLLLEAARSCTQSLRETQYAFDKDLHARQIAAQKARRLFPERAASVRKAMEKATSTLRVAIGNVDFQIAQVQHRAMLAHCCPGVPRAVRQASDSATTATSEVSSAKPASFVPKPEMFPSWIMKGCKVVTGAAVGVMFGMDWRFFSLQNLRALNPGTYPLILAWMMAGVAFALTLANFMYLWWRKTGERCTAETPSPSLFSMRVLRHTLFPVTVTLFVLLVEASIMRNAKVSSPLVRDPSNWLYFVGSLGLIFPVTLESAVGGWVKGCDAKERELKTEREVTSQADEYTRREETIVQSAAAQQAFSLDDYVLTLQERQRRMQVSIDAVGAPYLSLIAQYSAETEAPTTLSEDQNRTLSALEENARAAYTRFDNQLREYEEKLESLPGSPVSDKVTLCFVRTTNGDLTPAPPAPPKLFWRQRLRAFLGRVWKRLTRRKQKQEDTPEQTS